MAIFLPQTSTNLKIAAYFSTKREDSAKAFKVTTLEIPSDFCTCIQQCVPDLKVFTDKIGTDFYKNDLKSFFVETINLPPPFLPDSTVTANIINVDTGVVTPLVDGVHGTLIEGFLFWWFNVSWFDIWSALGFGRYRIETKTVANLGGQTLNEDCSPTYHLLPYSDKLANGTIRLEIRDYGRLNHSHDYRNLITSLVANPKKTVFEDQIRLPGSLKWESGNEETDHLALSGIERPSYQVKDQVRPKYELSIWLVSSPQFMEVYFDSLFATELNISDYNVYNFAADVRDYRATKYRSLPLIKESSNFDPTSKQVRKSFDFTMAYAEDGIFKTTN